MASKVAILIVNGVLPFENLQDSLEGLGYSCVVMENIASDIDLPSFNVCIIGVSNLNQKDKLISLSKRYLDKPFIYYLSSEVIALADEFDIICESNQISTSFTSRELELVIELTSIKRMQVFASSFSDKNPNSNHVRLKKIIPEEQAWRVLFEQSPNGILLADHHGNILYTNQAAGEMLGYSPLELIKMRFHDLVSEDVKPQVDMNIRRIINGESLITEVYKYRKDGSKRYVQLHEARVIFPDGNFGILDVSTDISRAKQAEEALFESMEKYQILVEKSNDGIIYARDGVITYANPRILEMLSISQSEFIGHTITKFLHPKEHSKILSRYKRRLTGESEPTIYETTLLNSNNESIPVEFNVNLTKLQGDTITIVFIRDISLRKETEKAIRESEESYRGLFDNASEAIYILDSSGVFLDVNINGQRMYGYSKEEIVGLTPEDIAESGLNDFTEIKRKLKLAYQGHSQTLEFWGRKKNGDAIPNEIILSKGNYFGLQVVMAMARDVSERKNAEAILKESEDKFRTLTEQLPVGLYRLSSAGDIIYSNPAFADILGFTSVDKLIGQNISTFSSGNFIEKIIEKDNVDVGLPSEEEMKRVDGSRIWVRNQVRVHYGADNEIYYADGVMLDITDRKLALDSVRESEEKFRAMVSAIPDQLFRISGDCLLIDFAPTEQTYFPTLVLDMLGKSLKEIYPKDVFGKFNIAISNFKKGLTLETFEYQIATRNETYYYETRIVPSGNNIFLVLQRDITQRKKVEEEVRMLAQAVTNVHDSISITDLNNNFLYVNPAFTSIYGYSLEEIVGKNASLLKPIDAEMEHGQTILEETIKHGWQGELINVKKDGSVFPIYLSTSCVFDEDGLPMALVGIANDISERKRTEQELIRAKEKAEESDRLKTAFLSNMSHEIRSPMNAVLGFIQLIKADEQLSETGKQYVDLIQNSGNQLLSLIEDIIDISKIQSNQLRLAKSYFDLNQLLEELFLVFSTQLKARENVQAMLFRPELANPSPFSVYSDPVRIRQILTNLLSNAIKFTPSGSIKFGYTVIIDDYFPRIQCYVKDSGIGISAENQMLIFERFRQADDSYTRLYGGSGLGLAISKGLVELLGGHIWVESQVGEGSEFFFTIPYIVDEQKEIELLENPNKQNEGLGFSLKGKTILIVEDTKDIRLYFERILERREARIVFASTAKEARKLFKQEKNIDLVLLDIRLPDADGYDLALEFKKIKPDLPIIAQTAYALQSELNKSIESGCDDYITKPLDSEALFDKINKLIG